MFVECTPTSKLFLKFALHLLPKYDCRMYTYFYSKSEEWSTTSKERLYNVLLLIKYVYKMCTYFWSMFVECTPTSKLFL